MLILCSKNLLSVFFEKTNHCIDETLTTTIRQTESWRLFATRLLNHIVTWSNMNHLASVASCFTEIWIQSQLIMIMPTLSAGFSFKS